MLAILILPLCELGLLGILSGIVGTMTVLRGRVFFAESITHGAFPGAVIGVVGASVFTRDHSILVLASFRVNERSGTNPRSLRRGRCRGRLDLQFCLGLFPLEMVCPLALADFEFPHWVNHDCYSNGYCIGRYSNAWRTCSSCATRTPHSPLVFR